MSKNVAENEVTNVEDNIEVNPVENNDASGVVVEEVETEAGTVKVVSRKSKPSRERVTALVEPAVATRLRNASYWTRDTVQQIVEDAIVEKVEALERESNGGTPFDAMPEGKRLRTGRRASNAE